HAPAATPSKRPTDPRGPVLCGWHGNCSSQLSFDERNLPDLIVMNGPVTEITVFSKQFAAIGSDGDVGIFRNCVEQFLDHAVEIFYGVDLALAQIGELLVIEKLVLLPQNLSPHNLVI